MDSRNGRVNKLAHEIYQKRKRKPRRLWSNPGYDDGIWEWGTDENGKLIKNYTEWQPGDYPVNVIGGIDLERDL